MQAPTKLNGYPVIESAIHANCVTVMVQKESEYVVATWWPELKSCWSWGHYVAFQASPGLARKEADAQFTAAKERNASR